MPLVQISTWPIPAEKKRPLIAAVTDAVVEAIGCPKQAVEVIITEVEKENWAHGGVCHADRVAPSAGE